MPIYHFNVLDSGYIPDVEGKKLPGVEAAKAMALETAGQLLKDQTRAFWTSPQWELEVTDHTGLILFQITMFGSISAAGRLAQ